MRTIWLLPLLACALLATPASFAQGYQMIPTCGTASPPAGNSQGYMDSTGQVCGAVSGSVASTATASAAPTPVVAGTGKPLNISLFSGLFTELGVGGTLVPSGHGVAAAALRVELPTDGTGTIATLGTITTMPALTAGSAIIGKTGIDQTTPGTTNLVAAGQNGTWTVQPGNTPNSTPWLTTPTPATSGGLSQTSLQVANNTTSVAIKASAGQLYGIEAYNNSATIAYIKIYNAAQGSTTCGSGTPVYRAMIPSNSTSGAGYISMNLMGVAYSTAITICVTTGFADNDTGSPAATSYIVHALYK